MNESVRAVPGDDMMTEQSALFLYWLPSTALDSQPLGAVMVEPDFEQIFKGVRELCFPAGQAVVQSPHDNVDPNAVLYLPALQAVQLGEAAEDA